MSSIFIIEYGGPTTEILFDLEKTALDLRMYLAEIARLPMSRISLFFPAGHIAMPDNIYLADVLQNGDSVVIKINI